MDPRCVPAAGMVLLIGTVVFALWKGGPSERFGAALMLISNVASDVGMAVSFPHTPQYTLFALDFALAVGLLLIALRYASLWLGIAMLMQSVALCAHAYVLGGDGPTPIQWMILNNVLSNLMLVCIVFATVMSWRGRLKRRSNGASPRGFEMSPAL